MKVSVPAGLSSRSGRLTYNNASLQETIATYDAVAEDYALRFSSADLIEHRIRFERALPSPRFPVLDAGCGSGRDCAHFERDNLSVVGLDLSVGLIRQARLTTGARLVLGDLRHLPFKAQSFAGVWNCAVLLHLSLEEAATALGEIQRVLERRGALFVSVRCGQGEEWRSWDDLHRRWFHLYSQDKLVEMVEAAGFIVSSVAVEFGVASGADSWVNLHALRR